MAVPRPSPIGFYTNSRLNAKVFFFSHCAYHPREITQQYRARYGCLLAIQIIMEADVRDFSASIMLLG